MVFTLPFLFLQLTQTSFSQDKIVDTNGAGDVFAGFLGAFVSGNTVKENIDVRNSLGG